MRFSMPRSVGVVILFALQRGRQAGHVGDGFVEVVGVLVALAVAPLLHGGGGSIAQVEGHRFSDGSAHIFGDRAQGSVAGVGFWARPRGR